MNDIYGELFEDYMQKCHQFLEKYPYDYNALIVEITTSRVVSSIFRKSPFGYTRIALCDQLSDSAEEWIKLFKEHENEFKNFEEFASYFSETPLFMKYLIDMYNMLQKKEG